MANNAALLVSLGNRLENCARNAVLAYAIPQSEESGMMVIGSSLEYSREEPPDGKLYSKPFNTAQPNPSSNQITEVLNFDQFDLKSVEDLVNTLWEEFREHAARTRKDPDRIGIARDQVLILADTWDPNCSYLLLPILYCFKNLIESDADQTDLNVILDISHFENEKTAQNQETLVYRLVSEISDRIDPDPKKAIDPILQQLGFDSNLNLSRIGFYVIDKEKAEHLFAKNHEEIEDIVFSFILGMVNPGVRMDLVQGTSFESLQPKKRFFSSLGSVGMVYDPEKIVDHCALRLANKIISEGILEDKSIQTALVEKNISEVKDKLSNPIEWFQELIKKPSFSVTGSNSRDWGLVYQINEIFYNTPLIDQVSNCQSISNIESYYQKLTSETFFGALDILEHNASIKTKDILAYRSEVLSQIYVNPELYPNLSTNLKSVLKFIKQYLLYQLDDAEYKEKNLDTSANYETALTDAKVRFKAVLNSIEPPPNWFRYIPEGTIKDFVRKILTGRQKDRLEKLEKTWSEIEQLTAKLISLPYEKTLAFFQRKVAVESIKLIKTHEENLITAEASLKTIAEATSSKLELESAGFAGEATEFNFLFDPVTKPIVDLFFEKYAPTTKDIALALLEKENWFSNGKPEFSSQSLTDLLKFTSKYYHKVREWDLARVINEFYVKPDSTGHHQTIFSNYLNKIRLLLTFSWEQVGESPNPPLRSALLSADGEDFWPQFFAEQPQEDILIPWGKHISPSPYFASFTQVLNGVSYTMIEHHFAAGKAQWEALSEADKVAFDIIPRQKKKPSPVKPHPVVVVKEPEVVDPIPDLPDGVWSLTCEWDFTPPGNLLPSHLEVSIQVSEANYTALLKRSRFVKQFHLYAEEKCDEIDQLVSYFKNLQSQHNWDSYTQASNVLAFVQSFIPYRRDIETKNVSDYARFPLETLWDRVGDCEDVAILCGAILSRLGYKAALLRYPGHLAFGVETSKGFGLEHQIRDPNYPVSYYYGESTSKDWRLGQIPEDYLWATPDFYRINESSWLVTPDLKEPEPEPKTE